MAKLDDAEETKHQRSAVVPADVADDVMVAVDGWDVGRRGDGGEVQDSALQGLVSSEAEQLLRTVGKNEIPEYIKPVWRMVVDQFIGPMPLMIEIACVLAAVVGSWEDFGVVLAMLLANAALGFREEFHSTKAMRELSNGLRPQVSCKRDGAFKMLDVAALVPGDLILLKLGNKVPCDCHFVEGGGGLSLDNAALTGESRPIKRPEAGWEVAGMERDADGQASYKVRGPGGEDSGLYRDQLRETASGRNGADVGVLAVGTKVDQVGLVGGGTVKQGEAYCVVDRTGLNTEIGRASAGGKGGAGKGGFQVAVERACAVLIGITMVLVVVMILVELFVWKEKDRIRGFNDLGTVLLPVLAVVISSVPVALPMIITVTLAMGASKMLREGAIVTNLGALQQIASMDLLCSDKTGTLTTAKMEVYQDRVWCNPESGFTRQDVLELSALASNADNLDDPIDRAVFAALAQGREGEHVTLPARRACAGRTSFAVDDFQREEFFGFNPIVKRTVAVATHSTTGCKYVVAKGILDKVLDTGKDCDDALQWVVGDHDAIAPVAMKADEALSEDAFKTIAVAVSVDDGPFVFAGLIPMRDPPRHDTAETIALVRGARIGVKMITGDHVNIAKKTSEQINLGSNIYGHDDLWPASRARDQIIEEADGFAKVTPADKLEVVHIEQTTFKRTVGMTGDGVNDAPALKCANIGIAVQGATDAARAAADIVLTKGGLSPIYTAILESRRIFKRLRAYVIYRLATTVLFVLTLFTLSTAFNFNINAFYVVILALVCDITALPMSKDRAQPSAGPSKPSLTDMLVVSTVLGILVALQSLGTYLYLAGSYYADDTGSMLAVPAQYLSINVSAGGSSCSVTRDYSYNYMNGDGSIVNQTLAPPGGVVKNAYCQIQSAMFLQLAISCQLLLFVCRTPGFFFLSKPGPALVVLAVIAQTIMSILPALAFDGAVDGAVVGGMWAWCVGFNFFVDLVKVATYRLLGRAHHVTATTGDNFGAAAMRRNGQRRSPLAKGRASTATAASITGRHGCWCIQLSCHHEDQAMPSESADQVATPGTAAAAAAAANQSTLDHLALVNGADCAGAGGSIIRLTKPSSAAVDAIRTNRPLHHFASTFV